jgi:hypothetical protein|tara:strand:+ start:353 stop:937 length:585 start_codon:yes stop_codon:yes gene_type:complete
MELEVLRFSSQKDSTSGALFDVVNDKRNFLCYTIEDEQRDVKVWGETRIPAGRYKLSLRKEGGFHTRYVAKYGDMHKGMIHVNDVPGFEFILWHTGNTDEHTAGCLIIGDSQESNLVKKDGFVGSSVVAYKKVYPYVAAAIENEDTYVTYIDYDGDVQSDDIDTVQSNDIMEKLEEISGELQVLINKEDKTWFN